MTKWSGVLMVIFLAAVVGSSLSVWSVTKNHQIAMASIDHIRIIDNLPLQQAVFQAAETFGRGKCGDYSLAEKIGKESLKSGIPASLLAAIAQIESNCNSLAISNKGAVGLMQIRVSAWSKQIDFAKTNLFDPDQNLETSVTILKGLIKVRGTIRGAVLGYNCEDTAYADQVTKLAGIK